MTSSGPTMSGPAATVPATSEVPVFRQREEYEAVQPELQTLDADDLPRINLDVRQAVVTVLGCVPELKALAPRIPIDMPTVDAHIFTKLERYALAFGWAHTLYLVASQPTEPVAELTEELRALVDRFTADASALAKRGLVDGSRLALLAGTNGAKNTAASAYLLVGLFRTNWARVAGKTAVALTELEHAETVAERLERAVGLRDQAPTGAPEAALTRLKAHALFVRTHDEARRVVSFLRWREGDVDQILPSLYAGRGGRGKASSELPEEGAPAVGVGSTVPSNGQTGGNGASPMTGAAAATPGLSGSANVSPGMPPSSPFTDG